MNKQQIKEFIESKFESYSVNGTNPTLCVEFALSDLYEHLCTENLMNEDLRKWFGKGPKGTSSGGGWDRYNTKGERIGKCGDAKEAEGKPKCLSKAKAAKLRAQGGKKAIANAVRRKKAKDPQVDRPGTGNKPINVSNRIKKSENVNSYLDKVRERRVKESSHTS